MTARPSSSPSRAACTGPGRPARSPARSW
jgi:hypothetical protein